MAQAFIDRIESSKTDNRMLRGLVLVNIAVFLVLHAAVIIGNIYWAENDFSASILPFVEMPGDPRMLLHSPWTVFTYMFTQYELLHLLFNMIWLFWFGRIFMSLFPTGRRLLVLYLTGGLGGAACYMLACTLLPADMGLNGRLIGSSAAVIAVVTATGILCPNRRMYLGFNISMAVKWVAVLTISIDLITITISNVGGHFAHMGGIIVGVTYALYLKKVFKDSADTHNEMTQLLDKVKRSGYTSLSPSERKRLSTLSQRIK